MVESVGLSCVATVANHICWGWGPNEPQPVVIIDYHFSWSLFWCRKWPHVLGRFRVPLLDPDRSIFSSTRVPLGFVGLLGESASVWSWRAYGSLPTEIRSALVSCLNTAPVIILLGCKLTREDSGLLPSA